MSFKTTAIYSPNDNFAIFSFFNSLEFFLYNSIDDRYCTKLDFSRRQIFFSSKKKNGRFSIFFLVSFIWRYGGKENEARFGLDSVSGGLSHYHVLIACSMVQYVLRVHQSTKTHAISLSKCCLAMLHKAHLICITLALWCSIAYYINNCNLSNSFGSDLLHDQHRSSNSSRSSSSSNTGTRLQFFPLSLYEKQ